MKQKRPSMAKAKKYADDMMSLFIRRRDDKAFGWCRICGIRPIDVNYHIFSRANMPTRYHALACVGSCRGCNYNEFIDRRDANRKRLENIYHKILGVDLYEELKALSKTTAKYSVEDLMDIAAKYKKMWEEIK